MSTTNLLELLLNLLRDPGAYREDPEGFLSSCGDVSPEDIREALILLQDRQDADFGREYNTGGNVVHVPPPPPAPEPEPGESNQEAAIRYLDTYVTNNYITNEGDTITDNSINQQIDTGGGDFDQDIDVDSVVASGDGSVAAGDDIEDSEITTGDDNIVGDGNVDGDDNTSIDGDDNELVDGDDNTVGFGEGDTSSTEIDGDVSVDDGSSLAIGGSSSVDSSDHSDDDVNIDNSDNSTNDSNNTTTDWHDESDNSSHTSIEDNDEYSSYSDSSDNSSYNDNDTTTTDSHDSTQASYSAEVV
jgi:hypothetical protein